MRCGIYSVEHRGAVEFRALMASELNSSLTPEPPKRFEPSLGSPILSSMLPILHDTRMLITQISHQTST